MKEKKIKHSLYNVSEYWDREDLIEEVILNWNESPKFLDDLTQLNGRYFLKGNKVVEYEDVTED